MSPLFKGLDLSFKPHTYLPALLSALMTGNAYVKASETALTRFPQRTIGAAIMMGCDPNARTAIYITLIFIVIGIFFALLLILGQLDQVCRRLNLTRYLKMETRAIGIIAGVGIGNFVLYIFTQAVVHKNAVIVLPVLILTIFLIAIVRCGFHLHTPPFPTACFPDPIGWAQGIVLAYLTLLGYMLFFEKTMVFSFRVIGVMGGLLVLYGLIHYALYRYGVRMRKGSSDYFDLPKILLRTGLPLLFIPVSIPLSNECQYFLSGSFLIHPKLIAFGVIIVLMGLSLALLGWQITRTRKGHGEDHRWSARQKNRYIARWYYPMTLLTLVIIAKYRHTMSLNPYDLFHTGEATLPTQLLFDFKKIPFIDFYPTHGLFDLFPQVFYRLLNGKSDFGMLLWGSGYMDGWFFTSVSWILLYFFLKNLTNPLFACLTLLFLPVGHMIPPYYLLFLVPGLLLLRALTVHNSNNQKGLFLSLVFILLWRIDFGLATTPAAIMVLGGWYWSSTRRQNMGIKNWVKGCINLFVPFISLLVLLLITMIVLILTTHDGVADTFLLNLNYILIQVPIASYEKFIHAYGPMAFYQYIVFPFIGIAYILYYGLKVFIARKDLSPIRHMLAFLAVASLIISIRSLHRHSLYEENVLNPYLLILVGAFFPFYVQKVRRTDNMWMFLIVFMGYYCIYPPANKPYTPKQGEHLIFDLNRRLFTFHTHQNKEARVDSEDTSNEQVVRFFKTFLNPEQTFYDFANAPLLYFMAGKKSPLHYLETVFHTSDPVQKIFIKKLSRFNKKKQLPFVLFKRNSPADVLDNVPNEIRNYRMAEFIYRHYLPFISINHFELWIDRSLHQPPILNKLGIDYDGGRAVPLILSLPVRSFDLTPRLTDQGLQLICGTYDPHAENFVDLGPLKLLSKDKRYFLELKCLSSKNGIVTLYSSFIDGKLDFTDVVYYQSPDNLPQWVRIPIPIEHMGTGRLSYLRIDPPNGAEFDIYHANLISLPPLHTNKMGYAAVHINPADYRQNFNIYDLPYIWGTYDAKNPLRSNEVLWRYPIKNERVLSPINPLTFDIPSHIDKSQGNYIHLRLETQQKRDDGIFTIAYGENNSNSISFSVRNRPTPQNHLIRISSQWAWQETVVKHLTLQSTIPVTIDALCILKGD